MNRKPRILLFEHYMEIGGAERAFLGLLNALDTTKVDVDVFIAQHTGEFMKLIPKNVNLLPERKGYSTLLSPLKHIVKKGHVIIALRRLLGKAMHRLYFKKLTPDNKNNDESIYSYIAKYVTPGLPSLKDLPQYDLAISFLTPHNIVLDKIKAKKKICWIHTDYSSIHINRDIEVEIWGGYDYIASISRECQHAFCGLFPELKPKIVEIENILSPTFIRQQADLDDVLKEIPASQSDVILLTIGRFSTPKKMEDIPIICKGLLDKGLSIQWYIIGYGSEIIRKKIEEAVYQTGTDSNIHFLGKKTNPYPYIKACDWYVQPSRYEGKSVVVREAQILKKPVIVTNYPTAASQINNGIDGVIVPMEIDMCIESMYSALNDKVLKENIISYLGQHDYGNETEVQKIYDLI